MNCCYARSAAKISNLAIIDYFKLTQRDVQKKIYPSTIKQLHSCFVRNPSFSRYELWKIDRPSRNDAFNELSSEYITHFVFRLYIFKGKY